MAAQPDTAQLAATVRELAEPLAAELEVDLVDVEIKGQSGRHVVKVIADALEPGAGLDVDVIATLSRRLASSLEDDDPFPGAYTLEVSSPGATRPLRRGRDFVRNRGREVRLHLVAGTSPGELVGEVVDADDEAVTLATRDGERVVPLADVDHGQVVLPW